MVLSRIHLRCAMKGTPGVTHLCTFSCSPPAVCPCSHLSWRVLRRGGARPGKDQTGAQLVRVLLGAGTLACLFVSFTLPISWGSSILALPRTFVQTDTPPLSSPASQNPHASFLFTHFSLWCPQKVTSRHLARFVAS